MQGFNRYIPPDYNPKEHSTLNSHQGKKHALGVRAKDIDKGILIVRFELPFNIWCGSCNAHIGAGVRYNAQKKKVGNYYSTPIYGFRCKPNLEASSDKQNAAYVVHEGARKKDEDWNPEENGGFAIHDTEAPSAADPPADPFAHVEKTIDQQTWAKTKTSRLTELTQASDRLSGDPYRVSTALRRKFREEKKIILEKQGRDDDVKARFGLHEDVDLGGEDVELAREKWEAARERAGKVIEQEAGPSSVRVNKGTPVARRNGKGPEGEEQGSLVTKLQRSTKKKYDPFEIDLGGFGTPVKMGVMAKGKIKDPPKIAIVKGKGEGLAGGLLSGYGSD